jgi:hypothetical protein
MQLSPSKDDTMFNLIKNWGKMERVPIKVEPIYFPESDIVFEPGRTAQLQGQDGVTWYNMTKDIPIKDGQWFIAVEGNGYICCCEQDPTMIPLFDTEIWQVETDLPRDEIFCQTWNGNEIVPTGPQEMTRSSSSEDRIAELEARLAALESK